VRSLLPRGDVPCQVPQCICAFLSIAQMLIYQG
jgi:hypothetical protein